MKKNIRRNKMSTSLKTYVPVSNVAILKNQRVSTRPSNASENQFVDTRWHDRGASKGATIIKQGRFTGATPQKDV